MHRQTKTWLAALCLMMMMARVSYAATFATDTFPGSSGASLSGSWSNAPSFGGGWLQDGAGGAFLNSTYGWMYNTGSPASADYYTRADFVVKSQVSGANAEVDARMQTSGGLSCYNIVLKQDGAGHAWWLLQKWVNGSNTVLYDGSASAFAQSNGNVFSGVIQAQGTTIKAYAATTPGGTPTLLTTLTDSDIAGAGRPGIGGNNGAYSATTGIHIANFSAADGQYGASSATAFTLTPSSSSGPVSAASTAFTLTPNGALSAGETVALTSSISGDVLTPSSLTFASGATAGQTFTVTPNTTAGSRTITATPSPGLGTAPTATYTASAPVPLPFPLRIVRLGDSITAQSTYTGTGGFGSTSPLQYELARLKQVVGASNVTVVNQGYGGFTTGHFLPSNTAPNAWYATATAAAVSAFGTPNRSTNPVVMQIMLGANDARGQQSGDSVPPGTFALSASAFGTNLGAIASQAVADGYYVVLDHPAYVPAGSFSGYWDSAAATRIASYQAVISALANGSTIFDGDLVMNQIMLSASGTYTVEGVHPNDAGANLYGDQWALGLLHGFTLPTNTGASPVTFSFQPRRGR